MIRWRVAHWCLESRRGRIFFALQLEPSLLGFEIARARNLLGKSALTSTAIPEPFCTSVGDPSTAQLWIKVFVCFSLDRCVGILDFHFSEKYSATFLIKMQSDPNQTTCSVTECS